MANIPLQPTPLGGKARILLENEHVKVVNLVLQPGEQVASHPAEADALFIAIHGTGTLQAGNESISMVKGSMLACPAGIPRSIIAGENEGLEFLVVRYPHP